MATESIMISSLFGGVSTQAPASRFPNQVETATNALLTVRNGLELRPGTRLDFAPAAGSGSSTNQTLVTAKNYRIHAIKRDDSEKYLVVYGRKQDADNIALRVFTPAGVEATVTVSAAALAYLNLNNASADQIRLVTVADYTLILNTTVALTASDQIVYVITQTHRDYDVMLSHTPANHTYHKTKASTATVVKGYHYYHLTDDAGGNPYTFPTWHRNAAKFGTTIAGYYQDAANNPGGFKVGMTFLPVVSTTSSWTEATLRLQDGGGVGASIFAGYTPASGDQIYITGGTNITPGWYNIASKYNDYTLVLASSPATGITANDITTEGIGKQYEVSVNMLNATLNDLYDVAEQFQDALQSAGCVDGLIEWVETDVLTGYFVITGRWRGLNTKVFAPTAPSSGYDYTSSGPFKNQSATTLAGTGTMNTTPPGNAPTATQTVPVADRWTKVPGPGDVDAFLDAATLPVKMVRSSIGPPATFTVDPITWEPRLSGDYATNPVPSLWDKGYKIRDLTFHRNRFWLMGGENIVASQAGDFFNFFLEDDENLGDSDPLDIPLSSSKVTIGDFIVPFRKTLLILAQAGSQFELNAPELLTMNTASVTSTTMYNTLSVRPDTIGLRVYMACITEDGTQLREYFYSDTAAAADAPDVSAHVKGYLPITIRTISACPNDDTVLLLPTSGAELYVYNTYFDGNKRVQSAWSKYTFTGADKVCDIAVIDSRCYLLVDDADGFRFVSFPIFQEALFANFTVGIRLDNMVLNTGSYNAGTGKTTWTLTVPDGSITHAIIRPGTAVALTKTDSTHYWAIGDYSTYAAWLGGTYVMSVELSKFYRRDQNGATLLDSVLQLVKLVLNHHNSGPYSLNIVQPLSRNRTITYTPIINPEEEGRASFYILGNAKDTDLTIQATGPKPVAIATGECAVTFNQLSR